jgi:hypothetical protein
LKRYLDGREPALPEGCVLDVELEAKELLTRFLPAGRAAVEEAYRGMRAELGRRSTPTELLHAHYLPHTLRAAHGSWFGFCRAGGISMRARSASMLEDDPTCTAYWLECPLSGGMDEQAGRRWLARLGKRFVADSTSLTIFPSSLTSGHARPLGSGCLPRVPPIATPT